MHRDFVFIWQQVKSMFFFYHSPYVTDTPDVFIQQQIQQGSAELKRTWLHDTVAEVIDKFVMFTDITELSSNITNVLGILAYQAVNTTQPQGGATEL